MTLIKRIRRTQLLIPLHRPYRKIRSQDYKNKERQDLEREPSLHDMVPPLSTMTGVRSDRSPASAAGLEEERDDVAGDEDARVVEGGDAGVGLAEDGDDAGEAEVDACGVEGGCCGLLSLMDTEIMGTVDGAYQ